VRMFTLEGGMCANRLLSGSVFCMVIVLQLCVLLYFGQRKEGSSVLRIWEREANPRYASRWQYFMTALISLDLILQMYGTFNGVDKVVVSPTPAPTPAPIAANSSLVGPFNKVVSATYATSTCETTSYSVTDVVSTYYMLNTRIHLAWFAFACGLRFPFLFFCMVLSGVQEILLIQNSTYLSGPDTMVMLIPVAMFWRLLLLVLAHRLEWQSRINYLRHIKLMDQGKDVELNFNWLDQVVDIWKQPSPHTSRLKPQVYRPGEKQAGPLDKNQDSKTNPMTEAPSDRAFFIDTDRLEFGDEIGEGASGKVWAGTLDGSTDVAIKVISAPAAEIDEVLEEAKNEAKILAQLSHPNLLRFYGLSARKPRFYFVTELCEASLYELILDVGGGTNGEGGVPLPYQTKVDVMMAVASGMAHLHEKGVTHRDLKPANILCSREFSNVKIADFGNSVIRKAAQRMDALTMTANIGTPAFMAPELIRLDEDRTPEKVSPAMIDVYSFGVMMWVIATRSRPYADATGNMFVILNQIAFGTPPLRPTLPPKTSNLLPDAWNKLMQQCWDDDFRARPTFKQIVQDLQEIAKKLKIEKKMGQIREQSKRAVESATINQQHADATHAAI